ncbi:hypothetical protein PIIN_02235 [Serendipita indica DSM 11827]|uniref:AB hydrolase-1 domain-containing protein n=1 Tax=Serendipita indica (strain DSM 11827) TaxID=1109443 RepID=G4TAL8_SERID|nr:hypothetical protein PIIN_02235 [Serendipita indica DSM 11827]
MTTLQTFVKGTVASAVGLSTLSLGLLYYGQNYLIYPSAFPPGSRTLVPTPADHGLPYQDLTLDTEDGVKLKSFLLMQRRHLPGEESGDSEDVDTAEEDRRFAGNRPTIIMLHGNAGNIGHRVPLARIFFSKMRCNVILVSYRGYGQSEGTPSEEGLKIDSQTVLDFIQADPVLRTTKVIYALILENTFLSIVRVSSDRIIDHLNPNPQPRLIPTAIPWLSPFSWLCHQKWDSANAVLKIPKTTPMLLLSGSQDEIVPNGHMRALWEIAIGKTNPDGTPIQPASPSSSATETGPSTTRTDVATATQTSADGEKASVEDEQVPLDGHLESNPDSREDLEYEMEGDKQELIGKRTRYRIWREFSKGMHNDTCVQPGYWAAVWEFVNSLEPLPSTI